MEPVGGVGVTHTPILPHALVVVECWCKWWLGFGVFVPAVGEYAERVGLGENAGGYEMLVDECGDECDGDSVGVSLTVSPERS